jgi:hypothetical protein
MRSPHIVGILFLLTCVKPSCAQSVSTWLGKIRHAVRGSQIHPRRILRLDPILRDFGCDALAATPVLGLLVRYAILQPEDTIFRPGQPWFDTDGIRIEAHGGGLFVEDGVFFWVGEGRKVYSDLSEGITLYSSSDLSVWTSHGYILLNTSMSCEGGSGGPFRIERPKIIRNPRTLLYVMWWHLDTEGFTLRSVGVATAAAITGPWTFHACFQPDGLESLGACWECLRRVLMLCSGMLKRRGLHALLSGNWSTNCAILTAPCMRSVAWR